MLAGQQGVEWLEWGHGSSHHHYPLDSKQSFLPSCALRRVNCPDGVVYSPRGGPDPSPSPVFQVSPRLLTQRQCSCWQDCARLSSHATARS